MNNRRSGVRNQKVLRLAMLGLFTALILVLSFTPLGYLKAGPVEITFIVIPVAVGAVLLGPSGGAILGAVFGMTSFIQAISGMSAFGAALMSVNGFYTFLMCLVPRVLMGWLAGVVFKAVAGDGENGRRQIIGCGAACLAAPLLNTILFISFMLLFFWKSGYIQGMANGLNILPFVFAFVGINGLIEMLSCLVLGTAISKALLTVRKSVGD